jgi:hypothetical protein
MHMPPLLKPMLQHGKGHDAPVFEFVSPVHTEEIKTFYGIEAYALDTLMTR